jgi:hypothetical protein
VDRLDATEIIAALEETVHNLATLVREFSGLIGQTKEMYEHMAQAMPDPMSRAHYTEMAEAWRSMEEHIKTTLAGHALAQVMAEQSKREGH